MITAKETLSTVIMRMRAAARQRRTARILDNLPDYIRKDIGLTGGQRTAPSRLGR
jgi:uncharacterized protein YjiS (DUF1127 family)